MYHTMRSSKSAALYFAFFVWLIVNTTSCADSTADSPTQQTTLVVGTPIATATAVSATVTIEIVPLDETATSRPSAQEDSLDPVFAYLQQPLNSENIYLLDSYLTTSTHDDGDTAWSYDNALVLLAFLARGTDADLVAARKLADAFVYAQEHDPEFQDGRIRDSYHASNFMLSNGDVNVDRRGSATGNMAWATLALVRTWEHFGDEEYLLAAQRLGQWIIDNTADERGAGGFTGGFDGSGTPLLWKATEHNADIYAAFMNLYLATGDEIWQEQAISAKRFLESMWYEKGGFFWTGTLEDGESVNPIPIPEDAQSWTLLALGETRQYRRGLTWAESTLFEEACSTCEAVAGYRFSDTGSGCWWEGTAHMALAWQAAEDGDRADELLQNLRAVRQAFPDGTEAIPAACEMGADTGFGWSYPAQVAHIGATAWYLFAELEHNPFWGVDTTAPVLVAGPDEDFLSDIAFRAFQYFWNEASSETGLVKDRANNFGPDDYTVASIAATGFGLTTICIGVDNGWITAEEGYNRALTTLRFFQDEMENIHGFYYHFVDVNDGQRVWESEVSSIDTALFLAGALSVGQCFPDTEVETIANILYERVDFQWLLTDDGSRPDETLLSHGWKPETGFLPYRWDTYSELMILYLLAIGSPTYPIPAESWEAWARPEGTYAGYTTFAQGPLFTHQYSQAWVDFRDIEDALSFNYFDSSINATMANRQFAIDNQEDYLTYNEDVWGLTASDGPDGQYYAYGSPPGTAVHDGTIAPSAAAGSIVFTPELSTVALRAMYENYGAHIWGRYGFSNAFNVDQDWWDRDVIAIDLGITLLMIENERSETVWHTFTPHPAIQSAIEAVGFRQTP